MVDKFGFKINQHWFNIFLDVVTYLCTWKHLCHIGLQSTSLLSLHKGKYQYMILQILVDVWKIVKVDSPTELMLIVILYYQGTCACTSDIKEKLPWIDHSFVQWDWTNGINPRWFGGSWMVLNNKRIIKRWYKFVCTSYAQLIPKE